MGEGFGPRKGLCLEPSMAPGVVETEILAAIESRIGGGEFLRARVRGENEWVERRRPHLTFHVFVADSL